jgi:hypothetical protein
LAKLLTKINHFFEGHRRKAFLLTYTHLMTKAEEGRFKIEFRFPLLTEGQQGMHGAIGDVFNIMSKDDSKMGRTALNVFLDGMTIEAFTTSDRATSKERNISVTGAKMTKMVLVPSGEGEKRQIDLHLIVYVPAGPALRDWCYAQLHKEFGIEAVYSQSEINFSDDPEDGDSDEDDEDGEDSDEDSDEPVPAQVKKSGPKQLAEFHAKQIQ